MISVLVAALALQDTTTSSFLKTVDIASGRVDTVYTADRRFEAPNWSRDGTHLYFNSRGRVYRIPAGGGDPPVKQPSA